MPPAAATGISLAISTTAGTSGNVGRAAHLIAFDLLRDPKIEQPDPELRRVTAEKPPLLRTYRANAMHRRISDRQSLQLVVLSGPFTAEA
jgi:hypothetical protein